MIGKTLGPFRVLDKLGEGGMGEVYRARDTKLDRDVAIKILPEAVAADPDRIARFQREAKTLAALNHPNIGGIHGLEESDGRTALVLELVEGPTLAEHIEAAGSGRGLPTAEALSIARQIADALEAAHEHGIIHRDLKPANVKVRPDGTVKVLDFGLAKASDTSAAARSSSMSPTLTSPLGTQIGVILGTAAYMAPEQARGRGIDKRADIWAFGCVLFEMLTGARAFTGEDVTDVLASIVKSDPNWKLLPEGVPANLRFLIERCLEKDRKKRLQDIGDFRLLLDAPLTAAAAPSPPERRTRLWLIAAGAAVVAAAIAGGAVWRLRPEPPPPASLKRFAITLPDDQIFAAAGRHMVAVSPDGRYLVYVANLQLYLRAMDQLEAIPIRGTEGPPATFGREPFFSPDSQWIGFWHDGSLKKIATSGGAAVTLCEASNPTGATWGADDTIVFGQGNRGIWQVRGNGGPASPLVAFEEKDALLAHGPQLLPGGRSVLFSLKKAGPSSWNDAAIVIQDLETGTRRTVIEHGTDARYLSTGHIAYFRDGVVLAVAFDPGRMEVRGGAVPLVEGVRSAGNAGGPLGGVGGPPAAASGASQFALSNSGLLAYIPGVAAEGSIPRTLLWVDRSGKEAAVAGAPVRSYVYPRLSPDPDASRVALDIRDQEDDIWTWDFTRQTLMRITRHPSPDIGPIWTLDGKRIVFSSGRTGFSDLHWQASDGTGEAEPLHGVKVTLAPNSISPDGRLVFHHDVAPNNRDLYMMRLEGDRQAQALVATAASELNGVVSPDGRWLAMESNESGRAEIWLRPFPDVNAGRQQVSTGGGTRPAWARSGRELFYMDDPPGPGPGANIVAMMAVPVQTSPSLVLGTPVKLFEGRYFSQLVGRTYDVSPDGKRFLMIKDASTQTTTANPQIIIVENWFEELQRRVPTR